MTRISYVAWLTLIFLTFGCTGVVGRSDPAVTDPPVFDADHPPRLSETQFVSAGANLNAIVYEAQGEGPHPTVILLHGFPGNERNLDLAQAFRRAGWNVVFFHYRGAWGSGGRFSFEHVIEDVAAVVAMVGTPAFADEHRVDPERLALVGHSMGGFAALVSGAELDEVDCVVSLAGANLGGMAQAAHAEPQQAAGFAERLDGWSGPIRGLAGVELVGELVRNADRFDTTTRVAALAPKDLLLIAGARDETTPPALHHAPLVEALRQADAASLQARVFEEGDHAFSGQRVALARLITSWLSTTCEPVD